jgi:hypothetical protein
MKKRVVCAALLLLLFNSFVYSGNPDADAKAKNVLNIIHLAFQAYHSVNSIYIEPQDYIRDPTTGIINGQELRQPYGIEKFSKVMLNWSGNEIPDGNFWAAPNFSKISLTWNNNRVEGVKIDIMYEFDFIVNYNPSGSVMNFTLNKNSNTKNVREFEIMDDRIIKITSFFITNGIPFVRCVKNFEYKSYGTTVSYVMYKQGKPNTPGTIISTGTSTFIKNGNNSFIMKTPNSEMVETYNDKNKRALLKETVREKVEETKYVYVKDSLFKEEVLVTEKNNFVVRTCLIHFSLNDQPESIPYYEKTAGYYKFNKDGELIYERNEAMKYRKKEKGVWSEWMFMEY